MDPPFLHLRLSFERVRERKEENGPRVLFYVSQYIQVQDHPILLAPSRFTVHVCLLKTDVLCSLLPSRPLSNSSTPASHLRGHPSTPRFSVRYTSSLCAAVPPHRGSIQA